jgi:hypothetical protein
MRCLGGETAEEEEYFIASKLYRKLYLVSELQ